MTEPKRECRSRYRTIVSRLEIRRLPKFSAVVQRHNEWWSQLLLYQKRGDQLLRLYLRRYGFFFVVVD
jgi:hypothetical protein